MKEILAHFPTLSETQIQQFGALQNLYEEWNSQINVISRKDIENFYVRHVLHSLAIAKTIQFLPGSSVLDVGTGGGFPGIPLAIMFPKTKFHLIDSIGKKLKVVNSIAEEIGLKNVKVEQIRAEELKSQYDFITGRAIKSLPLFCSWVNKKIKINSKHPIKNGILYLKGGDFQDELDELNAFYSIKEISSFFEDEFFETKNVVHIYNLK